MIRLAAEFNRTRTVDLGDGVTFTFTTLSYLDFEEIKNRASRMADQMREAADFTEAMEETRIGDRSAEELIDRVRALANQHMLDGLVRKAGKSWTGVFDSADRPLPLNPANWELFRDACPSKADQVYREITAANREAQEEGNG